MRFHARVPALLCAALGLTASMPPAATDQGTSARHAVNRTTEHVARAKGTVTDTIVQANPLLEEWDAPFGAPPFDRIEDEHYLPAFRAAMAEHKTEIQAIIDEPGAATFDNTIVALERSGKALGRVANVFFAVEGAHSNDALREIARTVAPELAAHRDDIALNGALYERVKAVYVRRDHLDLDAEQLRLLEETHKSFVRSGVNLSPDAQARVREINGKLAELSQQFGQNLLAETNAFELHVTDSADLGGLPANLVAAAADEARRRGHDSGWSFTLQRPSINPFLQYSPNREMRRQIFQGYALRGNNGNEHDNKAILSQMAALRAERAEVMAYETHAHFVLSDNMAENPDNVYQLLDQVWEPALRVAKTERDALQEMMHADGIDGTLQGWDWRYYAEKVRKARYDLDEEALRPYFPVDAVRDGAFMVANKLFGITFTELEDVPRWHPDQQVFEVREAAVQTSTYTRAGRESVEISGTSYDAVLLDKLNHVTGLKVRMWIDTESGRVVQVEAPSNRRSYLADASVMKRIEVANLDQNLVTKVGVAIPDVHGISRMKVKAKIEPTGLWVTPESLNVPAQKFTGGRRRCLRRCR